MDPKQLLHSLTTEATHRQPLRVYLVGNSHLDKVIFLSGLMHGMLENACVFLPLCVSPSSMPRLRSALTLFDRITTSSASDDSFSRYKLLFSLQLLAEVAQNNREALLSAGVVDLLMEVLRREYPDSLLITTTYREGSDLATITSIIRERGLHSLLQRNTLDTKIGRAIYATFSAVFAHTLAQRSADTQKGSSAFDIEREFYALRTLP